MRNPDWNLEAFALQWAVDTGELGQVAGFMAEKGAQLLNTDDPYHPYAVDHANEHLAFAAKRLRQIADTLDNLREYTNYPPTPETMTFEAIALVEDASRRLMRTQPKEGEEHD